MYYILLVLHSAVRWLVLVSLLLAIYRAYRGWLLKKPYTSFDHRVRVTTATFAYLQLLIGLWLYFISPVVRYFLKHTGQAIHLREIRFFGMEHVTMMLTAIVIITIGSAKAKRKAAGTEKFRTMAIWFTIGLFLILSSIPWSFSPLIHRPLFRWF